MIKIGTKAPDFELKDQHDNVVKISDLKGKLVLLSFHPLAWTDICSKQMLSLENNYARFEAAQTIPLGISIDSVPSKKAWSESLGLKNLKILADFWPHGAVAQLYDIFRANDGFSERANILINEMGQVVFTKVYPIHELPDVEEIIGILGKQQFTIS